MSMGALGNVAASTLCPWGPWAVLQPQLYVHVPLQANKDMMVLHYVSMILKEVVPLMEHPSPTFLAGLEEDLINLIMKHGQLVSPCQDEYDN
jgi:hypothetical protein